MSLTNLSFSLAVDWLNSTVGRGDGAPLAPGTTRERVQEVLEEIVLACTPDEIASWATEEGSPRPAAVRPAVLPAALDLVVSIKSCKSKSLCYNSCYVKFGLP